VILGRKHGSEPIVSNDYVWQTNKIEIEATHFGISATNNGDVVTEQ